MILTYISSFVIVPTFSPDRTKQASRVHRGYWIRLYAATFLISCTFLSIAVDPRPSSIEEITPFIRLLPNACLPCCNSLTMCPASVNQFSHHWHHELQTTSVLHSSHVKTGNAAHRVTPSSPPYPRSTLYKMAFPTSPQALLPLPTAKPNTMTILDIRSF